MYYESFYDLTQANIMQLLHYRFATTRHLSNATVSLVHYKNLPEQVTEVTDPATGLIYRTNLLKLLS